MIACCSRRLRAKVCSPLFNRRGGEGCGPTGRRCGARRWSRTEDHTRAVEGASDVRPVRRTDESLISKRNLLSADTQRGRHRAQLIEQLQIALVQLEEVRRDRCRRRILLRAEHSAVLPLKHDARAGHGLGAKTEARA